MVRLSKIAIIILIFIFIFTGCNNRENGKEPQKQSETDEITEKVKSMTLDEKIGQLLIVGFEGKEVNDEIKKMIKDYNTGGVILFERNVSDDENTLELINSIKRLNNENKVPLFISIDEEGYNVSRLPDDFTKLPPAWDIGKVDDENYSYKIGKILGKRLKALGINLNFAPVLDINSNPNNPVIGKRAFGSTAEEVSKHGVQVMRGLESENIIPALKHFPGHGDTSGDSHVDVPVVEKKMKELERMEFVPFKQAINKGADMVMTSHILFPDLDEDNPATLSNEIINNILRKKFKFNGVVITDDVTMDGLKVYDIGDVAIKSLKSGCDIILVCHGYENQVKIFERIKKEVNDEGISESEIDDKVYRILKLKEKYKIADEPTILGDIEKINILTKETIDRYKN